MSDKNSKPGTVLTEALETIDMTRAELSHNSGIAPGNVSGILNSKPPYHNPRWSTLMQLAKAMDKTITITIE